MTGEIRPSGICLLLSCLMVSATTMADSGIDVVQELDQCRWKSDEKKRLHCYDEVARRFAPPTYQGKNNFITEVFSLDQPYRLRYRSQGVIFVLYLRDEAGNVLQNLHIGGRGEDEYIIHTPGRYSLKMDGSAGWEIWLEPLD